MSSIDVSLGRSAWRWAKSNYPWTNVYGLARTGLALGTALTLIFNTSAVLFRPASGVPDCPYCKDIGSFSLFCLFPEHLEMVRAICIFVLVIVASGWRPRYTAFFHWWVAFSLQISAITLDGGDQVTAVLTFLILPIALTDSRKWHWQSIRFVPDANMLEILRRLTALTTFGVIRLQVAIIYFHAFVGKLNVDDWVNGTVLYYWFTEPTIGLPTWLSNFNPLLTTRFVVLLTWATLLLEAALFMALIMPKKARKYCLVAGILFHFLIALTMGLVSFAIAMFAALILYLRPFDEEFRLSFLPRFPKAFRSCDMQSVENLYAEEMHNSLKPMIFVESESDRPKV
ncbi:MAG: sporulation-delaying protein SdpB family protein [Candidatus Acidiferrum sp.]